MKNVLPANNNLVQWGRLMNAGHLLDPVKWHMIYCAVLTTTLKNIAIILGKTNFNNKKILSINIFHDTLNINVHLKIFIFGQYCIVTFSCTGCYGFLRRISSHPFSPWLLSSTSTVPQTHQPMQFHIHVIDDNSSWRINVYNVDCNGTNLPPMLWGMHDAVPFSVSIINMGFLPFWRSPCLSVSACFLSVVVVFWRQWLLRSMLDVPQLSADGMEVGIEVSEEVTSLLVSTDSCSMDSVVSFTALFSSETGSFMSIVDKIIICTTSDSMITFKMTF